MFEVFELNPTEIKLNKEKNQLTVTFEDGKVFSYSAEFLRVTSPSAEVQGHAEHQRKTVPGKKNVTIEGIENVGNYAVQLNFDDGHDTGIFSWRHFYDTGLNHDKLWDRYLSELHDKGLSR